MAAFQALLAPTRNLWLAARVTRRPETIVPLSGVGVRGSATGPSLLMRWVGAGCRSPVRTDLSFHRETGLKPVKHDTLDGVTVTPPLHHAVG